MKNADQAKLESLYEGVNQQPEKKSLQEGLPGLSTEDGIGYQNRDLAIWEAILKPEVFAALKQEVTKDNGKAADGYGIVRGQQVYEILMNKIARDNGEPTPSKRWKSAAEVPNIPWPKETRDSHIRDARRPQR